MKKYFLMLIMFFTLNAYAENTAETNFVDNYSIKINTKKLADYLELNSDQYDAVDAISNEFSHDMLFAAVQEGSRLAVTKNTIDKNIKYMSYVLNNAQMRKYLTVLNATINNRNINYKNNF